MESTMEGATCGEVLPVEEEQFWPSKGLMGTMMIRKTRTSLQTRNQAIPGSKSSSREPRLRRLIRPQTGRYPRLIVANSPYCTSSLSSVPWRPSRRHAIVPLHRSTVSSNAISAGWFGMSVTWSNSKPSSSPPLTIEGRESAGQDLEAMKKELLRNAFL
jgi:hypothetical protein